MEYGNKKALKREQAVKRKSYCVSKVFAYVHEKDPANWRN